MSYGIARSWRAFPLWGAYVLLPAFAGCGGGTDAPAPVPFETGTTRKGSYQIEWRAVPHPTPLNTPFELEVRLARADGSLVTGAVLAVGCEMPEHGHGMLREPKSVEVGGGLYRVEGMLLHMTGRWVMTMDVIADRVAESAVFELQLE